MLSEEAEKRLENKPLSKAVQTRKEELYSKVKLSVKQLDVMIWIAGAALAVVFILIVLEAVGIFAL